MEFLVNRNRHDVKDAAVRRRGEHVYHGRRDVVWIQAFHAPAYKAVKNFVLRESH